MRYLVNPDINIPWFIETAAINSDKETCTYSVPYILYQNVWPELHDCAVVNVGTVFECYL